MSTQVNSDSRIPVFNDEQRKIINYFFAKIRSVYGAAKYNGSWPTQADQVAVRQEWGKAICQFNYEEIDAKFEFIKRGNLIKEDSWPTVQFILNVNKNAMPIHAPYVRIERRKDPEYREQYLLNLTKLKLMLNQSKE